MRGYAWCLGSILTLVLFGQTGPLPGQTLRDNPDRLTATLVELSMLADPELCCYYPLAHVDQGTLYLQGFVPSQALRDKAIKVAQIVAKMPVADTMTVDPRCRQFSAQISTEEQLRAAAQTLKFCFPDEYRQWQLGLRGSGEIIVAGPVVSHEKKLLVSQKMRSLPGCKCVINHLQVPAAVAVASPKPAVPAVKAMPGPSTLPAVASTSARPVSAPLPEVPSVPAVAPAKSSKPALAAPSVSEAVVTVSPTIVAWESPSPVKISSMSSAPRPSAPAPKPAITATTSTTTWTASSAPASDAAAPGSSMPLLHLGGPEYRPLPPGTVTPVSASLPAAPAGAPVKPAPPPAAPSAPQPAATVGKAGGVQQLIEKAAGPSLSRLKVTLNGDRLSVQFFAPSESEGQRLAQLIMNLPALEAYHIVVKVDSPD